MAKPDRAIFEVAVRRFHLTPSQTLFVDDRADNVAAARRVGFEVHLFTGPEGLRRVLADGGLLPN
jgi:2-haloacid dehalogenase